MTAIENTAVTQPGAIATIYVGDLSTDVTELALWDLFSPYGTVVSIKVCRDQYGNSPLCYAYVNYRTKQEAEKAIKSCNYAVVEGKQCRVMWCIRDSTKRKQGVGNLFVKNIHTDLDSKSLYDAFSSFGPVMTCKIAQDEYGISKGFGFVQFYNEVDADVAIAKVNGVEFRGKKLFVSRFVSRATRVASNRADPNKFTNVFVKNFKDEWNLDDLKNNFAVYGDITSAIIKVDDNGKPLGYGFVNFKDPSNALLATKKMNGFLLPSGAKLYASKAMKKLERIGYLKKLREERKRELQQQYRDQNLYVKNFDENFTEERLLEEFSKFGTIKSAHVMRDEQKRSKCFGFVCFTSAEEAGIAIKEMNSKVIDGRPLYVAIAQTREERRKSLEQNRAYSGAYRPSIGVGMPPMTYFYPPNMMQLPHHFQGYRQPHHPGGMRSGQRPMMQGSMAINPQMMANSRPPYMYMGGNVYRQRISQLGQSVSRPDRLQFQGPIRPMVSGVHRQLSPNRPPVNSAPKDTQHNVKTEERAPIKAAENPKNDFGDRIFKACQDVFSANSYDVSKLQKVCGVVLEYCKNNKIDENSAEQLKPVIVDCYTGLISSL